MAAIGSAHPVSARPESETGISETTHAAAREEDLILAANLIVVSDYRDRGASYSEGKPALQAILTAAHDSGFYAGLFASSIGNQDLLGAVEIDIYGGWAGEILPNLTADAMLIYYFFPDADESVLPYTDAFEATFLVAAELGPFHHTVGVSYSWEQAALDHQNNLYLFTDLTVPLGTTPLIATLHVGYTDGAFSIAPDRKTFDWSAQLAFQLEAGLGLAVKYIGMDGPKVDDFSDDTVVLTLSLEL